MTLSFFALTHKWQGKCIFDLIESDACYYLFVIKNSSGYLERSDKERMALGVDVLYFARQSVVIIAMCTHPKNNNLSTCFDG